jgi:hypothetical protein
VQDITKEQFEAYNKVRETGKYNMVMDANDAAKEAGLSMDQYWEIIKKYDKLYKKIYHKEI